MSTTSASSLGSIAQLLKLPDGPSPRSSSKKTTHRPSFDVRKAKLEARFFQSTRLRLSTPTNSSNSPPPLTDSSSSSPDSDSPRSSIILTPDEADPVDAAFMATLCAMDVETRLLDELEASHRARELVRLDAAERLRAREERDRRTEELRSKEAVRKRAVRGTVEKRRAAQWAALGARAHSRFWAPAVDSLGTLTKEEVRKLEDEEAVMAMGALVTPADDTDAVEAPDLFRAADTVAAHLAARAALSNDPAALEMAATAARYAAAMRDGSSDATLSAAEERRIAQRWADEACVHAALARRFAGMSAETQLAVYEESWRGLDGWASRDVRAAALAWPVLGGVQRLADITEEAVAAFVLHPVRAARWPWSASTLVQRDWDLWTVFESHVLWRVRESEREMVMVAAERVQMALTQLLAELLDEEEQEQMQEDVDGVPVSEQEQDEREVSELASDFSLDEDMEDDEVDMESKLAGVPAFLMKSALPVESEELSIPRWETL